MKTTQRKDLRQKIENCHSIAWDTCHKIYILMDEEQTEKMKGYGYETLIEANYSTNNHLLYSTVLHWYRESCGLRFIEAVETALGAKGTGEPSWHSVVPQGG